MGQNASPPITEKEIEPIILGVHEGKYDPENLPEELYQKILGYLSGGMRKTFQTQPVFRDGRQGQRQRALFDALTFDIYQFSAAKTWSQTKDMAALLFDANGNKKPFSKFKKEVLKIHKDYNVNWLRSEHHMAIRKTRAAADWLEIQEKKAVLPYLQYRTVGDERVRRSHRRLHGVTKPVDDPFWERWYPPNDWGCRCIVQQVVSDVGELTEPMGEVESNPLFDWNPGRQGRIFGPDHPYYQGVKGEQTAINFGLSVPYRHEDGRIQMLFGDAAKAKVEYDSYGNKWDRLYFNPSNGGYVVADKKHNKGELEENLKIGSILADTRGERTLLLPVTPKKGIKTPDARLFNKDLVVEFKVNKKGTPNSVKQAVRSAKKQARYLLLWNESNMSLEKLVEAAESRFNQDWRRGVGLLKIEIYDMKGNLLWTIEK